MNSRNTVAVAVTAAVTAAVSAIAACNDYGALTVNYDKPDLGIPVCGDSTMNGPWLDCATRCVPATQLTFSCTEKLGLVAFARVGVRFGYGIEDKAAKCSGATPYSVWSLSPRPNLTDVDAGMMTPLSYYSDCFVVAKVAPFTQTLGPAYTPTLLSGY